MRAAGPRSLFVVLVVAARDVEQRRGREPPADLREQTTAIMLINRFVVENHNTDIRLRKKAVSCVRFPMLRNSPSRLRGLLDERRE